MREGVKATDMDATSQKSMRHKTVIPSASTPIQPYNTNERRNHNNK